MFKLFVVLLFAILIFSSCYSERQADNNSNIIDNNIIISNESQQESVTHTLSVTESSENDKFFDENELIFLSEIYDIRDNKLAERKTLNIYIDFKTDNTSILDKLTNLENLTIYTESFDYNYQGDDEFGFLKNYTHLESLCLTAECAVFDIDLISSNENLSYLSLNGFDKIENFEKVCGFQMLETLILDGDRNLGPIIENLDSISELQNLRYLYLDNIRISKNKGYSDLNFLKYISSTEELHLCSFPDVKELDGLSYLNNLTLLEIYRLENLKDYEFLYDLVGLQKFIYTEYFIDDVQLEQFREVNKNCDIVCAAT